jgi:molybdopterin molybdotransferase
VLPAGRVLRAQEIGALAESGRATVEVYRRPRVAVLATGDELVPASAQPGPGQIRNSNEPMLCAQIRQAGGEPVPLGIARDERQHLRERIEQGLACDLLLLSGGVSAGKLDLVPSELAAAGVRQVFHQIRMKPGKPLWFGVFDRPTKTGTTGADRCYVFGLPGNPVSSMVCCELFARAALRRLMGIEPAVAVPLQARLTEEHSMRGNRPTYHPARLEWQPTGPAVHAVDWIGSSDLRATVDANALVYFPPGDRVFRAGEMVDVYPW